jgi:hypothetical protein
MLPTLQNITLAQWIAYTDSMQPLDEQLKQIQSLPDCAKRDVLAQGNYVRRAFETATYFGVSVDTVEEAILNYEKFCLQFADEVTPITIDESKITFGQFIDAKQMVTAGKDKNRWSVLQYLITIFATDNYKPEMLNESCMDFRLSGVYKLDWVLSFSAWWDNFNNELLSTYTLFQDSGEDEGANMREHMERWGWINFLKSMAKTKVFDIQGSNMNSIDCARAANLSDVLHWASEEKDYSIALMRDMESKR